MLQVQDDLHLKHAFFASYHKMEMTERYQQIS
jgi:hypothetical protein